MAPSKMRFLISVILILIYSNGFAQKISYTVVFKINGKVNENVYSKVESIINNLPNKKKVKLKQYTIDRTDLQQNVQFSPDHKPNFYDDEIFSMGTFLNIDSNDLNIENKNTISNSYAIFDKIITDKDTKKILDELNARLMSDQAKKSNHRKDYRILIIINAKTLNKIDLRLTNLYCPDIVQIISKEVITRCNNGHSVQPCFSFNWTLETPMKISKFYFSIIDSNGVEVFKDSITYPSKFHTHNENSYWYYLTESMFFSLNNRYPGNSIYSTNLRWRVSCHSNDLFYSDYFIFGKCPGATDNLRSCDEKD